MGLRAVSQARRTLLDVFDFQDLALPDVGFLENRPYVLVIEILSVYPGTKYKDCLVSEVRVAGQSKAGMMGFGPD